MSDLRTAMRTHACGELRSSDVGAKVALSILSTFKPGELASAIAMGDKASIRRSPGVGPKVAERLVIELKDKAPAYSDLDPAVIRLSGELSDKRAPQPVRDAVSALVNLGYGQPQAAAAISAASSAFAETSLRRFSRTRPIPTSTRSRTICSTSRPTPRRR